MVLLSCFFFFFFFRESSAFLLGLEVFPCFKWG